VEPPLSSCRPRDRAARLPQGRRGRRHLSARTLGMCTAALASVRTGGHTSQNAAMHTVMQSHTDTHRDTHTLSISLTPKHMRARMHAHMHARTHACMHTRTHTHYAGWIFARHAKLHPCTFREMHIGLLKNIRVDRGSCDPSQHQRARSVDVPHTQTEL
jgi:hypothetical protein